MSIGKRGGYPSGPRPEGIPHPPKAFMFTRAAAEMTQEPLECPQCPGAITCSKCNVTCHRTVRRPVPEVLIDSVVIDASELDYLPNGAIIRADNGHAYEKSMQFTMVGRRWLEAGNSSPERAEDIPLPATLLYNPIQHG